MEKVLGWVTERLHLGDVPRVTDVVDYAHNTLGLKFLTRKMIAEALRLHPAYEINSTQQRQRGRSRKYRPIVVNNRGSLHADIAFVSKSRNYEIPKSFRAGFLVARDVLTRYTFIIPLQKDRTASSMIKAFTELLDRHGKLLGVDNSDLKSHGVSSISFDKETSVMSKSVQAFLAERGVRFFSFKLSSSKSKVAEGAIKIIRTTIARLRRANKDSEKKGLSYWQWLYSQCEEYLNSRPVVVSGKNLRFAPKDLYSDDNLKLFLKRLHKAVPAFYFSQFDVSPRLVDFLYPVGTLVRAKLIVTSSQVLGNKTSEQSLTDEVFEIKDQFAYVTRAHTVGKSYVCESLFDGSRSFFDEADIVPAGDSRSFDISGQRQEGTAFLEKNVPRVTRLAAAASRQQGLQERRVLRI
jgi:hypothetical protein